MGKKYSHEKNFSIGKNFYWFFLLCRFILFVSFVSFHPLSFIRIASFVSFHSCRFIRSFHSIVSNLSFRFIRVYATFTSSKKAYYPHIEKLSFEKSMMSFETLFISLF